MNPESFCYIFGQRLHFDTSIDRGVILVHDRDVLLIQRDCLVLTLLEFKGGGEEEVMKTSYTIVFCIKAVQNFNFL